MTSIEKLQMGARHHIARSFLLFSAIPRGVAFYQGSWRLAVRRVLGVLIREGVSGVVRRARILIGGSGRDFSSMALFGEVPPPSPGFCPRVSIVVPNFNHAKYLPDRLDSIYSQTYTNIEVILLDDCSSDESVSVLSSYAARYAEKTITLFSESNSGGVFYQWSKGLKLATGDLVWIAESDDYCSENFLEELVRCFQNSSVKLAFSRSDFVCGTPPVKIWTSDEYLKGIAIKMWDRPFVRSAHSMVKSGWSIMNIVPNVSGAIFRHPGNMRLLDDPLWLNLRLCGDWVFYLSIIRGGLVAYSPNTSNYYRQHARNTSVSSQKKDLYYREHEIVAQHLVKNFRLDKSDLKKQEQRLYLHWCSQRGASRRYDFKQLYNLERVWPLLEERKANVVMAVYALAAGGGETFPIMLANLLEERGYAVTLLNCREQATEPGIQAMLSESIPLLELDRLDLVSAVFADMGIELVHSHHAWVDVSLAMLLMSSPEIKQIVTMHGMYEMMTSIQLEGLLPLLRTRVDRFVYTAEKNLRLFSQDFLQEKNFCRIDNALPVTHINPFPRDVLKVGADDFLLCLVARAIPDKGWEEAIKAVVLARAKSSRKIHLLLIGEGPEAARLNIKNSHEFVHFCGFQKNIRDYFAASDIGFLPSRFKGESAPLVLIDCLLSGKPVLASNIGEIRYMLNTRKGLAGALFDLNDWAIDVDALAEIIAMLASDAEIYKRMLSCVPLAASKFETSKMIDQYEQVYQQILTPSVR